jgi:hypothetical protein
MLQKKVGTRMNQDERVVVEMISKKQVLNGRKRRSEEAAFKKQVSISVKLQILKRSHTPTFLDLTELHVGIMGTHC